MLNLDTCTIDELRDELARLSPPTAMFADDDGVAHRCLLHRWTLDAIAGLMPKGWTWKLEYAGVYSQAWLFSPDGQPYSFDADGKTPIEALARCVAKVLRAVKEAGKS